MEEFYNKLDMLALYMRYKIRHDAVMISQHNHIILKYMPFNTWCLYVYPNHL